MIWAWGSRRDGLRRLAHLRSPALPLLAALIASAAALLLVAHPARAGFPGLNGKIALARCSPPVASCKDQIYTVNSDGSGATDLSNNAAADSQESWSPDGLRIAFARAANSPSSQLWVMNADGSDQHGISNNAFSEGAPAWSPDGAKIVFQSPGGQSGGDIYVRNSDGTGGRVPLTTDGHDRTPVWSPDGTRIAYTHYGGSEDELWVMGADGSNPHKLVGSNGSGKSKTDWSPNSTQLVWTVLNPITSKLQLVVVSASDGTLQRTLTDGSNNDAAPAWSPDGTEISFVRSVGAGQLWAVGADGQNAHELTSGTDFDHKPDWQPLQPPNAFTFGALKRNKKKGTARLTVNAPFAGTLALSGNGVVPQRTARSSATASVAVTAAGPISLLVKSKGKRRKMLRKKGKVKLLLSVTFTPTFPVSGTATNGAPTTQTKKVTLRKKLK